MYAYNPPPMANRPQGPQQNFQQRLLDAQRAYGSGGVSHLLPGMMPHPGMGSTPPQNQPAQNPWMMQRPTMAPPAQPYRRKSIALTTANPWGNNPIPPWGMQQMMQQMQQRPQVFQGGPGDLTQPPMGQQQPWYGQQTQNQSYWQQRPVQGL